MQVGPGHGVTHRTAVRKSWGSRFTALRTLGHLIGRSARSDLGADEDGITSENVQSRKVTIMPRLIRRARGQGDNLASRRGRESVSG
jgi:hypothetical protein